MRVPKPFIYERKEKSQVWNKSEDLSVNVIRPKGESDEEEVKKNWKSDGLLNSSNSTLSLHIAAFENSNEYDISDGKNAALKKQLFPGSIIQNSFEFPRQQEGGRATAPDIMQFRASQRMRNPNQFFSSNNAQVANAFDGQYPVRMSNVIVQPNPASSQTYHQKIFGHQVSFGPSGVVVKMTDSKYFTTTKKGEIFELKTELNSDKKEKKREAVKKVIASMTVGKDVSALFPDVVNCMQTDNVELKKLVYLYLMNYAKSQPDLAIMAVNTFVKDCEDPNPLIRALAVRTMGCIRVDKITEYLCEPLRKCMKDEDPYVRKTAAVCVAKLHDINPTLVEDQGFVELLNDLLSDSNPMVVANAVAAITEINESRPMVRINLQTVNKLLTALNECTEWGQVFILDALANYEPKDEREAQNICERISPRLAHANAAVVLSTVKVLMKLINLLPENSEFITQLIKKLAPPMVTLLSAEPEIQYVALRNINLIVQKR
uniref:Clathrin/coatomer adaptor adaptin-like N-terminal domain-containing protein n=1 Tax=Panagrolaimus sp. PS1159 TaxID=55785 RepID=A0AC35FGG5_9BILA